MPPPGTTPPQTFAPQAPAKGSGFLKGCLIVALIAVVVLAIGGFLFWRFVSREVLPQLEESAGVFASLSDVPPGPCYDLDVEDGVLVGWDEVSCNGSRQVEVSFAAQFDEGPFPGDDYLAEQAEDTCRFAFEAYVGIPPDRSVYGADWLLPTEETWSEGARQGICLVVADDGSDLTGTVKESRT